jgi:hypothetical protein
MASISSLSFIFYHPFDYVFSDTAGAKAPAVFGLILDILIATVFFPIFGRHVNKGTLGNNRIGIATQNIPIYFHLLTGADDFLILTISSEPKDDLYILEMLAPFLLLNI